MNHSTSKLWNKFQLLREEWGGPGRVGVEMYPGYTMSVGEDRMCGTMVFVLKQKWNLTKVKMKFSWKVGIKDQETYL